MKKTCSKTIRYYLVCLAPLFIPLTILSQEMLENPGFEGEYETVAPGWQDSSFSAWVNYARHTGGIHSGEACQLWEFGSEALHLLKFIQWVDLEEGHTYRASIWLRSTAPLGVRFSLRIPDAYFHEYISLKTVDVGTDEWVQVEITAVSPATARAMLIVTPLDEGALYIDDASMVDITPEHLPAPRLSGPVPKKYFGMHINCLPCQGGNYPPVGRGLLRIWDATSGYVVVWSQMETSKGNIRWDALDGYVNLAQSAGADVMFILGTPPAWASSNHGEGGPYGAGCKAPPRNIQDWLDFVRAVVNRYKGRIKYYEYWNEVDHPLFFSGSVDDLFEMAKAGYGVIKGIDPDCIVGAPNITQYGIGMLDAFLYRGGGEYCDMFSLHTYYDWPEDWLAFIDNTRLMIDSYGYENKPLLNTEGASELLKQGQSQEVTQALMARTYIEYRVHGLENFSWYGWDVYVPIGGNGTAVEAYRQVTDWLLGASLDFQGRYGNTRHIQITRDNGYYGHILWALDGTSSYEIPSGWGVNRRRDLGGGSQAFSGSSVNLNLAPVLFEGTGGETPVSVKLAEGRSDAVRQLSVLYAPQGRILTVRGFDNTASPLSISIVDSRGARIGCGPARFAGGKTGAAVVSMVDTAPGAGVFFVTVKAGGDIRHSRFTVME
jgi:hypothetical protein